VAAKKRAENLDLIDIETRIFSLVEKIHQTVGYAHATMILQKFRTHIYTDKNRNICTCQLGECDLGFLVEAVRGVGGRKKDRPVCEDADRFFLSKQLLDPRKTPVSVRK
jgi:hypothetical protein